MRPIDEDDSIIPLYSHCLKWRLLHLNWQFYMSELILHLEFLYPSLRFRQELLKTTHMGRSRNDEDKFYGGHWLLWCSPPWEQFYGGHWLLWCSPPWEQFYGGHWLCSPPREQFYGGHWWCSPPWEQFYGGLLWCMI